MAELRYDITGTSNGLSAAVRSATTNLNTLERSANQTNAALRNDITSLNQLQETLKRLNREKLNIVDSAQLATQNRRIQELEAEIRRATNAGRVGFDQFGNSIARSTSGLASFGVGLTRGLGYLRTFAYFVPGLGIAGIFNLAFEGITAAAGALGIFNTEAEKSAAELKKIQKEQEKEFGKDSFIDGAKSLSDLTQKIQLAKNGFLDKNKVLKEYNETIGLTIGRVNSLGDAEQKIIDKGPAYLQFLLLKSKAEYAFRKAAEDSYNIDVQRNKFDQQKGTPNANARDVLGKLPENDTGKLIIKNIDDIAKAYNNAGKGISDNIQKVNLAQLNGVVAAEYANTKIVSSLTKTSKQSQKVAEDTQKQLQAFAKENGFNVFAFEPDKSSGAKNSGLDDANKKLEEIFRKTQSLLDQSGLSGYALEIQKINDKYDEQRIKIQSILDERKKLLDGGKITQSDFNVTQQKADKDFAITQKAREKELSDAKISEAQRVANEIQRINDEFGVRSEVSRQKEILQIEAKYNAEIVKAKENAAIIAALDEGKLAAIAAVNQKYADLQADLYSKIQTINDTAQASIAGKEEDTTQKIRNEWNARKKAAEEYYKAIEKAAKTGDPFIDALNGQMIANSKAVTDKNIQGGADAEITRSLVKPLTDGLSRAVRQFGGDFIDTLTNIDTYAKGTFASIFSDLTAKLSSSLNKVFMDVVLNGLSQALSKAISSGTSGIIGANGKISGLGAAVAGVGIAGGVLSAATPKTSTLGQAAGGALSGAGAGFLVGGPVGAVVGGVIGAISGIFGSSSARKREEELQKQQLEEAKKQTEYLRQQQQAYQAQVIGRVTANGPITGINLGSQGQLIATISGKDIQFVLDRTKNGR